MHIGERIKALMDASDVSTADMAKHCEVTPGAVSNWFATGRISKPNMLKAAALLQVDVGELITGGVGERGTEPPLMLSEEERDVVLALRARRASRVPAAPPPKPGRVRQPDDWIKRREPQRPMAGGRRVGDPNGKATK